MAWDDDPPTEEELKLIGAGKPKARWDDEPPTPEDLGQPKPAVGPMSFVLDALQKGPAHAIQENRNALADVAPTLAGTVAEVFGGPLAAGIAGGATRLVIDSARDPQELIRTGIRALQTGPISALTESPLVRNAAKEAAIQAVPGVAFPLVTKAARAGGRGAMSVIFGPSSRAVKERLARPQEIISALPVDEAAHKFEDAMATLNGQIEAAGKAAGKLLSDSTDLAKGAFSVDDALGVLYRVRGQIPNTYTQPTAAAKAALDSIADNIRKKFSTIPGEVIPPVEMLGSQIKPAGQSPDIVRNLSQVDVRNIVGQIDDTVQEWVVKTGSNTGPLVDAMKSLRIYYDGFLKNTNKAYGAAMEPYADKVDLFNAVKKHFNIESPPGKGYQATNATISALKNVLGKSKGVTRDVLERLKDSTGFDFVKMADDAAIAAEFAGDKTRGSRRVNLGAVLGTSIGGAVGGAMGGWTGAGVGSATSGTIGALVGAWLDTNGGRAAAALIDAYNAMPSPPKELREAVMAATKGAIYEFRKFAGDFSDEKPQEAQSGLVIK